MQYDNNSYKLVHAISKRLKGNGDGLPIEVSAGTLAFLQSCKNGMDASAKLVKRAKEKEGKNISF